MKKDRRIIKDLTKYLPSQIIPGLVGFFTGPLIASVIDPAQYGSYVLARSVLRLGIVVTTWASISLVRVYPECELQNKVPILQSTTLRMNLLSSCALIVLGAAVLLLLEGRINPDLHRMLWYVLPLLFTASCYDVFLQLMRCRRSIVWYSSMQSFQSLVGVALGYMLLRLLGNGGYDMLTGLLICQIIILPIMWKPAGMSMRSIKSPIDTKIIRSFTSLGVPLAVGNVAGWFLSLGDRYVLEVFRGSTEVGIYSACYGISENSLVVLAALFSLVSGSLIFRVYEQEGEDACRRMFTTITRFYIIVGIPATVMLAVLAKPVVSIMFPESYQEGYRVMPMVVSGAFLFGLQQRFHAAITIAKKNRLITMSVLIAGILNVLLNLLFIPMFGFIAAGATTLVSYAVLTALIVPISRRYFKWHFPFSTVVRVVISAGLMAGILYVSGRWISNSLGGLALRVVIAMAVYLASILLVGEFNIKELLRTVKARLKRSSS